MATASARPASSPEPTLEGLRATIRKAGLRSTTPRVAVLRRLVQATTPVSHGELAERLGAEGMDRTTIYRNLVDLTDAGLVQRTDLGDHVWRFELKRTADEPRHPHFTCVDCGSVACLPEVTVSVKPGGKGVPRSLLKQKVEIQLRGTCDECA